jgi:NADPH-dependent F420 reductase
MIKTIAIVGGTGKEGKGLAYRWAKAGYEIIIGSRKDEKAKNAAAEVLQELGNVAGSVIGMENPIAAEKGDIVVLTVPYSAHKSTLDGLRNQLEGKILIDVTVPLVPPKVTKVQMPKEGSAAQEAQALLGDGVKVVAAFQSVSYEHLFGDHEVDCDILVSGNGKESRNVVLKLIEDAGLVGYDAGPIENSVVVEGLTSILIGINKQYGIKSAGIRITGIPDKA